MFEKELAEKFRQIFEVKKVSFDEPGPAGEQDCLFINIELSRNTIRDGRQQARVAGSAVMIAQSDQLPFGFFSKKIAKADPALTKPLFFYDFEDNTKRYRNLVQRGFSFVYFFDGQYDPETGEITSVELSDISEE